MTFSKDSFRKAFKVSNSLDVGPDLGPNSFQRLPADDKSHH